MIECGSTCSSYKGCKQRAKIGVCFNPVASERGSLCPMDGRSDEWSSVYGDRRIVPRMSQSEAWQPACRKLSGEASYAGEFIDYYITTVLYRTGPTRVLQFATYVDHEMDPQGRDSRTPRRVRLSFRQV